MHRGGCRSFARGMFEMENPETNEKPDVITFYKAMHYNTTKSWIAPRGEENYEKMVEMNSQPTEGDDPPKTIEEIRVDVLGVRSGYVPGLGYGVVPQTRGAGVASVAAAASRVEMEQLRTRAENAENELHELRSHTSNSETDKTFKNVSWSTSWLGWEVHHLHDQAVKISNASVGHCRIF